MATHLMFISAPGLRLGDLRDPAVTPNLRELVDRGWGRPIRSTFPCVTSPVQASMWTGTGPGEHGVIANGFFHRERNEAAFWVGHNDVIAGEQIWTRLHRAGKTSAVWHAQNIKGAAADFIVTPAPVHEADGTTRLWCYSKPEGLYAQLLAEFGHFPLQHYWGPLAGIQSSEWITKAAAWLQKRHAPNLSFVYLPHLDYAAQKFGPDSPQASAALAEFDRVVGQLVSELHSTVNGDVAWVVASEYVMTRVDGAVFANRLLREAGLLAVHTDADGKERIDLAGCKAFALVDHQLAHVFLRGVDPWRAAEVFRGVCGVDRVLVGGERRELDLEHPRSGDIVLISTSNSWFAYYWWLDDAAAPGFARTVDIHAKPGYDPVELFIDPATRNIPIDAALVRGSHGVPATSPRLEGALICAGAPGVEPADLYRDTDMPNLICGILGCA